MQRVAGFREGLIFVQESPDPNLFATEVRNCAGSTINLGVFSAKVSLLPHVHLRPKHYIVSIIFIMHDTNVSLFLPAHYLHHQIYSSSSSQLQYQHQFDLTTPLQGQKIREIYLPIPAENPTLGISLQWTPLSVTEDVWHILDVIPNSPADNAGLLPYGDYVIGSPEGLVRGDSGLGELVEDVRSSARHMSQASKG